MKEAFRPALALQVLRCDRRGPGEHKHHPAGRPGRPTEYVQCRHHIDRAQLGKRLICTKGNLCILCFIPLCFFPTLVCFTFRNCLFPSLLSSALHSERESPGLVRGGRGSVQQAERRLQAVLTSQNLPSRSLSHSFCDGEAEAAKPAGALEEGAFSACTALCLSVAPFIQPLGEFIVIIKKLFTVL